MIIISPYSRPLKNGNKNPKNYPYWKELLDLLNKKENIVQIGSKGEEQITDDFRIDKTLKEIKNLIMECKYWISVDNFLPHLAHHVRKPGVVIWSLSDPAIFGYSENLNILKDKKYLRKDQFNIWDDVEDNENAFVKPSVIMNFIEKRFE